MDSATAVRLAAINRAFYEEVAGDFSRSRERLNPGIGRALTGMTDVSSLLDLGCGDGRVGLAWRRGDLPIPWSAGCRYVGLDGSAALLAARAPWPDGLEAVHADLADPGWPAGSFDVVCCFAVLHHVPGREARLELLRRMAGRLRPGGRWIVSVWQFLHRERFRRRLVDWSEVGLEPEGLDEGDLLLDWRRGGRALRYVHHYGHEELESECREAGLAMTTAYRDDGDSGDLGLYLVGEAGADAGSKKMP